MRYLNFENNENPTYRTSPDYDRLYKIRRGFSEYSLNNKYSALYNHTEYLVVDDLIVKLKGRTGFRQYIPKNKEYGIKLYKLCDNMGYTNNMVACIGKQRANAAESISLTHGKVPKQMRNVEGVGPKLFMDNYFPPPQLFSHLYSRTISSCNTVWAKDAEIVERGPSV
jgi:hypothetical protein